jgi:hypothetical protein
MSMALKLTEEQRQFLPDDEETPVEVIDERGRKFYLISETAYRMMQAVMESEEIDPSLYEFDDSPSPTTGTRAQRRGRASSTRGCRLARWRRLSPSFRPRRPTSTTVAKVASSQTATDN